MKIRSIGFSVFASVIAGGCAAPAVAVRASSVPILTKDGSSADIHRSATAVLSQLTQSMDGRGFHLSGEYPAKDGSTDKVYAFKGRREAVTIGAISSSIDGYTRGQIATYQYGSIFYVRIQAPNPTEARVFILGKPMLNGQELCSDDDSELKAFQYWCQDSKLANGEKLLPTLRGKEEADTVRGVLVELKRLDEKKE